MLIYFLEDDMQISYIIQKTIINAGYEQQGFMKGKEFLEAVRKKAPDVLTTRYVQVLLAKLREFYKELPVIMLSDRRNG